jgi:hypothetical protein
VQYRRGEVKTSLLVLCRPPRSEIPLQLQKKKTNYFWGISCVFVIPKANQVLAIAVRLRENIESSKSPPQV